MAFPVIGATATGSKDTVTSSYSCPLPSNIQEGELLVIFLSAYQSSSNTLINTPSGWVEVFQVQNVGQIEAFGCFCKIADGDEGPTVTFTTTQNTHNASVAYRISGAAGIEYATANGSSSVPNPPVLEPTWGERDALWIAVATNTRNPSADQSAPANYGNFLQDTAIVSGQDRPRIAAAVRELRAESEDPGAFGTTGAVWVAATVAILGDEGEPRGAFPVIEDVSEGSHNTVVTSWAAPLPNNIQAGDLLLLLLASYNGSSNVTVSTPSGWTQLFQQNNFTRLESWAAFYKVATGSEGSTVTVAANQAMHNASICYRISKYLGVPVAAANGDAAAGVAAPPELTPSFGEANALWIAAAGAANAGQVPFTQPLFFSDLRQITNINSNNDRPRIASAVRRWRAGTLQPTAFGGRTSQGWGSATIAIQAAEGGSARQMMHYRRLRI